MQRVTFLTRLVEHAIISESDPIRTCSTNRVQPLVIYSHMSKHNTFFPMIRLEGQTMRHAWIRL